PRDLLRADILFADADLRRRVEAFIQDRDGAHEKSLKAICARVQVAPGGLDTSAYTGKSAGAQAELDRRARGVMAKSGDGSIDYRAALNQVSREDPALETAARDEGNVL